MNRPGDLKAKAIALYKAGSAKQARLLLDKQLTHTPDDVEAMALIAEMHIHKHDFSKAEKVLTDALKTTPRDVSGQKLRFNLLQNLIGLLLVSRQSEKAAAACRTQLTPWPAQALPTAAEKDSLLALARYCLLFQSHDKARELWDSCRGHFGEASAAALEIEGRLALLSGGMEGTARAIQALEKARALDPGGFSIACAYAAAVHQQAPERSRAATQDACRIAPFVICNAAPSQKRHVLILNGAPNSIESPSLSKLDLHFKSNYPSQFSKIRQSKYLFSSAFPEYAETFHLRGLPRVGLVINNLATPEAISPDLQARAEAWESASGAPVVNPMAEMMRMRRDALPGLLSGVDRLRVPKTLLVQRGDRSWEDVVAGMEAEFDYPMIVRSPSAHQSSSSILMKDYRNVSAKLLADRSDALEFLKAKNWEAFYAIEFFNLKRDPGVYRKIRAVFVGDELVISAVAYWNDWMVGGWRASGGAVRFYRQHPDLAKDGLATVRDPEANLGAQTLSTLMELRGRIPLDFFGVDFDLDDDGRIAIFEASAAMAFLPAGAPPPDLALPPEPSNRINAAFDKLLEGKIREAARPRRALS